MARRKRNYAPYKNPPFSPIVGSNGGYTKEYMDWAILAENYPCSDMAREDFCGIDDVELKDGVMYIETGMPFKMHDEALEAVLIIRNRGGLAYMKPCQRNKVKLYMIWFNPNGSNEARDYVMSW